MSENDKQDCLAEEEDSIITLGEFIEEEQRLETDARAVLGPSDDEHCTYNQGYMKRQALYACTTCTTPDSTNFKPAGICLACSYHCHEGHDLVELYTKRNFRCDCGNSRFNGKVCSLIPEKDSENDKNSYNQNFKGVYCTCSRPYPDPEFSDIQLQCSSCEDWFHTKHLNAEVPPEDAYSEMICGDCSKKLTFLEYYTDIAVKATKVETGQDKKSDETELVEVVDEVKTVKDESKEEENKPSADNSSLSVGENSKTNEADTQAALSDSSCKLSSRNKIKLEGNSATFWPNNLRAVVCSCASCLEMYTQMNCLWIIDQEDTVEEYERIGKLENQAAPAAQDQVMGFLSRYPRTQQVEAILNYNDLKSNLVTYLQKFATAKKVVREEDIREFFSGMEARKRARVDGIPPGSCR